MLYAHDWEEDQDSNQSCTKCGVIRGYFNWYTNDCIKPDEPVKEPYIETKNFEGVSEHDVKQILSGGDRDYGGER